MATIAKNVTWDSNKQSEIVDDIRRQIAAGNLPPRAKLPGAERLSRQYSVSRKTSQRAIRHLVESGHLVTRPRSGTYVAESPPTLCDFAVIFALRPIDGHWSRMFIAWQLEAQRVVGIHAKRNKDIRFSFFYVDYDPNVKDDYNTLLRGVACHEFAGLIFPWLPDPDDLNELYAPDLQRLILQPDDQPVHKEYLRRNLHCLRTEVSFIDKGLDFLASRGCKRVAFIVLSRHKQQLTCRMLNDLTRAHGMTTDNSLIQAVGFEQTQWAVNSIQSMADRFRRDVDALFVTDDNLLTDVVSGLEQTRIRVPDDLLVLSVANFPHIPEVGLPVRFVGYDVRGLVSRSIDVLLAAQRKEKLQFETPVLTYMDYELPYDLATVRKTTEAPLKGGDRNIE